ncbi:hypothetical protein CAAN3_01S07492 [[Candida] anglica]
MISVTTVLILVVLAYFYRDYFTAMPTSNPLVNTQGEDEKPVVEGKFTPATLVRFNGSDDPQILIAVKGKVYDVSQGASFYGPGGPYENFAGRDASRGLAKNSFEKDCLTPINQPLDTLDNLSKDEQEALDGWEEHFSNKYPMVGRLNNEN